MAAISGSFLYLSTTIQILSFPGKARRYLRLGFLAVKWVDFTSRQHIRQDEVLEDLDPLRRAGLVIVPERLEEVFTGTVPLPCCLIIRA
jgi:hypothetical protein